MESTTNTGRDIVSALTSCRLADAIDPEDWGEFVEFLNEEAIPLGRFVVALSLDEGGLAWFSYRISSNDSGLEIGMHGDEGVYVPKDLKNTSKPDHLDGLPVWEL